MDELDSQYEAEEEQRASVEKRRHQESSLRSMFDNCPLDEVECDIIIDGIRISRFVGEWECEECPLAYKDHTLGFMYQKWDNAYKVYNPIKVCIKDYLVKCKNLGIKARL